MTESKRPHTTLRTKRRVVRDPDACRTCYWGQRGCASGRYLGEVVCACIGYYPAAAQI